MKNSRRLALRRETLTDLTADELSLAAGAIGGPPSLDTGICKTAEYGDWSRDVSLALSLHKDCSWSCI